MVATIFFVFKIVNTGLINVFKLLHQLCQETITLLEQTQFGDKYARLVLKNLCYVVLKIAKIR